MGSIVCSFITFLLESILLWQYSGHLFVPKTPLHQRILLLCILYTVCFFGFFLGSPWINSFLTLFTYLIFFTTQYKIKWYTVVFHTFILMGIMMSNELAAYNIISAFSTGFNMGPHYWHNMILHSIFSKALSFLVIHVLIYFLKERKESNQTPGKIFYLLTLLPAATIFTATTFVLLDMAVIIPIPLQWMSWIGSVLMLIANILVFILYWYEQKKSAEFSEMKLLLEREASSVEYYKMLLVQNENQNILIHDMKKHLQSISFLNKKQEREQIDTYIQNLMNSSSLHEFSRFCDNDMLNMILHRYSKLCKNKNIAFYADIRSGSTSFISNTDLTSLFCNLLDNAAEASEGVPEAFIDVHMDKRENTPFVTLSVKNSCAADPFTSNHKLITHKADSQQHGLGLKSIQKAVKQYNGEIEMGYEEEDKTFHTNILLRQPM